MPPVMILATGMKNIITLSIIRKIEEKKFEKALEELWPDIEMNFDTDKFDK